MINASRFTRVQDHISGLVLDYLKIIKQSVANYAALPLKQAMQDSVISRLHKLWQKEFASIEPDWPSVQSELKQSVDPMEVITINSTSTDTLDYTDQNYPKGRSVIAVGGLGLSRGLTLEGLIVSYFLRNSIMYDTLLQMGRWFGYRDGFSDLCRIFLTQEAD